eukprot:TRINITY_DN153_c0_g1_i1.p2 TRINITY_DN153_c0_g1~~TRINITY_DN153_c0_g1_i1.p2  ORF type:complete len:210 (+),score=40.00 TRINITY_DN153_c0_g1_i1:38-631(+)
MADSSDETSKLQAEAAYPPPPQGPFADPNTGGYPPPPQQGYPPPQQGPFADPNAAGGYPPPPQQGYPPPQQGYPPPQQGYPPPQQGPFADPNAAGGYPPPQGYPPASAPFADPSMGAYATTATYVTCPPPMVDQRGMVIAGQPGPTTGTTAVILTPQTRSTRLSAIGWFWVILLCLFCFPLAWIPCVIPGCYEPDPY